jgi:gamma-glutamyl-gamma-aminobutyraldehyde dehydrogenase
VPDLDTAVQYAVNGIYGNQGEVCNAGSRLIVDARIHDEFVSKFLEKAKKSFAPGDPLDPATTMGPLVTREQQKRVLSYIDIGKKEGAKLALGGATPKGMDKGCYVAPTLFTGVKNDMRIAKEEIFGPVTGVLSYKKLDDAIAMANDSIYGLAASIWTSDVSTAHKAARDIEAGIVWVNCFDHGDMTSIWGGFKQSGMGRDKCLETLTTVTQTKSVWMHLG